ncbi:MAG: agmatine deiminase family protein [Bacteroidia bacterium]
MKQFIFTFLLGASLSLLAQNTGTITTPPSFPVRTAAEWEEIQTLNITWTSYTSVLREIVRNAQTECKVIIACTDSNTVKSSLTANNIPLTNLVYLQQPYNTVWARDYSGNTVYKNEVEDLMMVDWIYNRPRPKDDTMSQRIARYLDIPYYATKVLPNDLVNTGGNFMSDGQGTGFASKLVLEENQGTGYSLGMKTEAEIDTIMKKFMGINRYIKMETLPYDGIHHIDMHMKLLDEETLLVGEYPQGVADGPQIEANLQYVLANYNSVFGTPYRVVRVAMPPDNGAYPNTTGDYMTYANNVFVNKTVIVPTYNPQYDSTALRILRENLPGYKVVGIPCNSIISASGALHCITHSVGVNDPLLIVHQPKHGSLYSGANNTYDLKAKIQHKSGISTAVVHYNTGANPTWQVASMTLTNPALDEWSLTLPLIVNDTIHYYIEATANNGKMQVRPMTAPTGYYTYYPYSIVANEPIVEKVDFQPIFPNPGKAITCFPVQMNQATSGSIKIYDMIGKEIATIHEGLLPAGDSKYFIDASQLISGTYMVILQTENQKLVQKWMVR